VPNVSSNWVATECPLWVKSGQSRRFIDVRLYTRRADI
jgi:hypothetical protein